MENYEHKYKKALEKAKKLYSQHDIEWCDEDIEYIFPELSELAESDDERIRKWLIKYFNKGNFNGMLEYANNIKSEEIISWLEKQGESYTKKDIDDAYLKGVTDAKNEIEKQYEVNYQIRKDIATFIFNYRGDIKDRAKWMDYLGIKVSFVEKQGEENKNQEIKNCHKFNIGDIISNGKAVYRVDDIRKNCLRQDCYFLVNIESEKDGTRYLIMFDSDGKISNMGEVTWLCEEVDESFEKQGEEILINNDKYQTVPVKILNRLYKSEKELEQLKQCEQKETLCDKCRKTQPSHSCQDITALGRCALEKQGGQKVDNSVKTFKDEQNTTEWILSYGKNETAGKLIALAECLEMDGDCEFNGLSGNDYGKLLRVLAKKLIEVKPAWSEEDEKSNYNPYKVTVESISAMVEKYAPLDANLQDFYNNVKVKCKDAIEYDNMFPEKQDEQAIAKAEKKNFALSLIKYLDDNRIEGCMNLSSIECEDLENAVVNSDWQNVYNYMKKKLEKQGERSRHVGDQPVGVRLHV